MSIFVWRVYNTILRKDHFIINPEIIAIFSLIFTQGDFLNSAN